MSALASSLPTPSEVVAAKVKPGPRTARAVVHSQLDLGSLPDHNKFRYHWRGKCQCWTLDLKEWIEAQA